MGCATTKSGHFPLLAMAVSAKLFEIICNKVWYFDEVDFEGPCKDGCGGPIRTTSSTRSRFPDAASRKEFMDRCAGAVEGLDSDLKYKQEKGRDWNNAIRRLSEERSMLRARVLELLDENLAMPFPPMSGFYVEMNREHITARYRELQEAMIEYLKSVGALYAKFITLEKVITEAKVVVETRRQGPMEHLKQRRLDDLTYLLKKARGELADLRQNARAVLKTRVAEQFTQDFKENNPLCDEIKNALGPELHAHAVSDKN